MSTTTEDRKTILLEKAEALREGAISLVKTMLERDNDETNTYLELVVEAADFCEICYEKDYRLDKYTKACELFQYEEKTKSEVQISGKFTMLDELFIEHSIEVEKDIIELVLNKTTEEEIFKKAEKLWETAKEMEKIAVLRSKKMDSLIIFQTHWNKKLELESEKEPNSYYIDTAPSEKESSSCFIATATMGNINHPKVIILREFRDKILLSTIIGNNFINYYYKIGPRIANFIQNKIFLRKLSYLFIVSPMSIMARVMLLNRKRRSNKIGNTFVS